MATYDRNTLETKIEDNSLLKNKYFLTGVIFSGICFALFRKSSRHMNVTSSIGRSVKSV